MAVGADPDPSHHALVKTLTEVHGGSVAIDSRVGAGTRVTVRLPAAQAAATTAAPVAA